MQNIVITNYKEDIENISALKSKLSWGLKNNILSIKNMSQSRTWELLWNNSNWNLLPESPLITQNWCIDQSEILKPIILRDVKNNQNWIRVMATKEMWKACFIEHSLQIDNQWYNFLQWKWVWINSLIEKMKELFKNWKAEGYFINDDPKLLFPFMIFKQNGSYHPRYYGTAYYDDILLEEQNSQKIIDVTKWKIRTPKVLKSFKFSKEFAKQNNIPEPISDDSNDLKWVSLKANIEAMKDSIIEEIVKSWKNQEEAQEVYNQIYNSYEAWDYSSSILGQNIRATKNIFRVSDLILALKNDNIEDVKYILNVSQKILEKEFKQEFANWMTSEDFLWKYSHLLWQQIWLFIDNKIIHWQLKSHRQDISLAAEICDFDSSVFIENEKYLKRKFDDPNEWYNKLNDEKLKKRWFEQLKSYSNPKELYTQIIYIWSHIYPILKSFEKIEWKKFNVEEFAEKYLEWFISSLSLKSVTDFKNFLLLDSKKELDPRYDSNFSSVNWIIKKIWIDLDNKENNFMWDYKFFDLIISRILSKFS